MGADGLEEEKLAQMREGALTAGSALFRFGNGELNQGPKSALGELTVSNEENARKSFEEGVKGAPLAPRTNPRLCPSTSRLSKRASA